uniref:Uncharacterized protein n=1 Tax=Manihot esculenta TaxID=3983 RepID=A0A2C9V653_MANES
MLNQLVSFKDGEAYIYFQAVNSNAYVKMNSRSYINIDIKTENSKILKLVQSKVQESKCDRQNYSNIFLPNSTQPLINELEKK